MVKFFMIDDIKVIDLDALTKLLPGGRGWNPFNNRGKYIGAMLQSYRILKENDINTPRRLAHFVGQGLIETGFLNYTSENLNYSASALRRTWPTRFTEEEAKKYHRKPKEIAEKVYGDRLGNTEPGDGWRYRGRGFFQLTGRDNYRRFGEIAGVDLEKNPEQIENNLKTSIRVAAAYWRHMKLGPYADENNMAAVSRGVNRGNPIHKRKAHGEAERAAWTKLVLGLLNDPTPVVDDGALEVGDRGDAVKMLQKNLNTLGYDAGKSDGVFGRKTSRAVAAFQVEAGIEANGRASTDTLEKIKEALEDNRENPEALAVAGVELPTLW